MRALAPLGPGIIATVLMLVGCISTHTPDLFPLGHALSLGPDQGILVVEIEASEAVSQVTIESMDGLTPTIVIKGIIAGRHPRLVLLPAGNYRWSEVEMGMGMDMTRNGRPLTATWRLAVSEEHWHFAVRAGVANYPGLLVLDRVDQSHLRMFTLNRSAQLLEAIRTEGMGLLEDYPIVYSGRGRDDFLEFYASKLASKMKEEQVPVGSKTSSD